MNSPFLHYSAVLETQGPVFIGDGKELVKKEYILTKDLMAIQIIDIGKLYSLIKPNPEKLARFEAFLMNPAAKSLEDWLRDENLLNTQHLNECIRETIPSANGKLNLNSKPVIKNFIRDPYGNPYIPGSSLKGMLRTILLTEKLVKDSQRYAANRSNVMHGNIQGRKNDLGFEASGLEEKAFHTLNRDERKPGNAVNDYLSGLVISDSEPISPESLIVCDKIDVKPDNEAGNINMERICLRPNTQIHFEITIDQKCCPLNAKSIMAAVSTFDECCEKNGFSEFECHDHLYGDQVFLGGGAGFVTKTIVYPLLGKNDGIKFSSRLLSAHFPKHFHEKDESYYGISPRTYKMTSYNGKLLPFGLCKLKITQ